MTHELIDIINAYKQASAQHLTSVLVTVVGLNGSSYRKPGVRMLITKDGKMTGAISGGCVEKEIERQAKTVFQSGIPKLMTYDGRYRLGCEGLIYILIEPFKPNQDFLNSFAKSITLRHCFRIESYHSPEVGTFKHMGSVFYFKDQAYPLNSDCLKENTNYPVFKQTLKPQFRLLIFGSEHDAVQLCKFSVLCGWNVHIMTSSPELKIVNQFSDAHSIVHIQPNEIQQLTLDSETAIVLMTHNFAKDLAYLLELSTHANQPNYIGILGSKKRMLQLESALFEHLPHLDEAFIDLLHGPAGLNIGSITPQEIAISILSEITQNVRIPKSQAIEA